jgi:AcrR family transcriptional regulator
MPRKTNTKERIKDEALNLFSQFGFAGGSVRDIGKKAGVRESAMYNYFSSKKEILNELIEDAKRESIGANLITDELLETINKPQRFIVLFSEILMHEWDKEKQKKYLKLILIEQFRNTNENGISVNLLIAETVKIWEMIFSQMLNFKFIKKQKSNILATQFVYPLFMLRLQYLTKDETDWKLLNKKIAEHTEYFWNSIKK